MTRMAPHLFGYDLRAFLRNRQWQFFTLARPACFGNLVASVAAQCERGVLKRRRATPVPAAAVIAGRVLTAVVIAVVMAAVLLGIGWAAYGAHVPGRTALALAVTVVIGAASFCCLGYALTSLIRNEDAALPSAMAITLAVGRNRH